MSCDRKPPEIHLHFHGVALANAPGAAAARLDAVMGGIPTPAEAPSGTPEEKLTVRCAQLSDACTNVKAAMTDYLRERYPDSSATFMVDRNAAMMRLESVIAAVFDELGQATA